MNGKMPSIQLIVILATVVYFYPLAAAFSSAYGGMISLINTGLVNRHIDKQRKDLTISAQTGVSMMAISVVMRMTVVVGLTLVGYFGLKLNAEALIVSLVLGLIGFLMDKVLQK